MCIRVRWLGQSRATNDLPFQRAIWPGDAPVRGSVLGSRGIADALPQPPDPRFRMDAPRTTQSVGTSDGKQ